MLKSHKSFGIFIICLCLSIGTLGCDRISSVVDYFSEYFSGANKKTVSAQPGSSKKPAEEQRVPVPQAIKPKPIDQPLSANTLARVGPWSVTIEEFNERLKALKEVMPEYDIEDREAKRLVLDELINQQLLVLDAQQAGLKNQKEINAAVDEFRRTLIVREVVRKVAENIKASDEEAMAFYENNKEVLHEPMQWHVRAIVVDSQLQANEILVEVLKGIDFAEMAKQHSIGETAANGGDLGFISEAPFPEMANALLSLEAGQISGVFKGPDGFYIVKVEEKKGGEPIAFEKIKEEIIQNQTLRKQQQVILDYIEQLKQKTKIEINEGLLR